MLFRSVWTCPPLTLPKARIRRRNCIMTDQAEALETRMELTTIPGTSLKVSPVAIGTWAIGGWMWGGTDEAASIATIRTTYEHGINLVDTAPVSGFSRSEKMLARAISDNGMATNSHIARKPD